MTSTIQDRIRDLKIRVVSVDISELTSQDVRIFGRVPQSWQNYENQIVDGCMIVRAETAIAGPVEIYPNATFSAWDTVSPDRLVGVLESTLEDLSMFSPSIIESAESRGVPATGNATEAAQYRSLIRAAPGVLIETITQIEVGPHPSIEQCDRLIQRTSTIGFNSTSHVEFLPLSDGVFGLTA